MGVYISLWVYQMKKCGNCVELLDDDKFPIRRGKRLGVCKDCYRQNYGDPDRLDETRAKLLKEKNDRRKERCRNYLADILMKAKCIDCGITDPVVLEFDHRDASVKYRDISLLSNQGSIELLKVEVEKCDIVCANCHRRRTVKTFNHWRSRLCAI